MIRAAKFRRMRIGLCLLALGITLPAICLSGFAGAAWAQQADRDGGAVSMDSSARPLAKPESLQHPVGLRRGFQFGAGPHNITVKSEPLQTEINKDSSFSDGGTLHIDWLLDSFRVTYMRQLYRPELEGSLTYQGQTLQRVAFDSDQLWLFHGGRPWYSLYLGYGLGFQRREVFLTTGGGGKINFAETLAMAGLMLDYAFAPPVSLQIRLVQEQDGRFFQASGSLMFLSYTVSL